MSEIIYIDPDTYHCHRTYDDSRIPYETGFFIGKCDAFVCGHRCIPSGKSWTRPDGFVFHEGMIAPWKPYPELDAAQRNYEKQLLAEYESLVNSLYLEATS